ncbi:MAG: glycosyltransferase, partial [Stackebrandtia sp.]
LDAARNAAAGLPHGLSVDELRREGMGDLARVLALQAFLPEDLTDALALFDLTLAIFGPGDMKPEHQGVHAQTAYCLGERERAAELLDVYRQMPEIARSSLELDLINPFVDDPNADGEAVDKWFDAFQGLLPASGAVLSPQDGRPVFDRLAAKVKRLTDAPEKISVVVTCFKPDSGLATAVRSILDQSWTNLEVLVVDDGSGADYDAVLDECASLDARVRVLRLDVNAGTYTARNAAFDAAAGEFVTFQDSDDWSHPRRLERQARALLDHPEHVAVVSDALKLGDDMSMTQPGRPARILCTPSLMFRKDLVLGRLGYLDAIRKGADTEFLTRIEAAFGARSVRRLNGTVHMLMRQTPDSLSRAEFRAGWMHPAREAYRSSYQPWHLRIESGKDSPYLDKHQERRRFSAPGRFRRAPGDPTPTPRYDAVFACDWRPFGGPQKSILEEIKALTASGKRVGVFHMESYRFMTVRRRPMCTPIQELINDGTVDHVLPTDDAETALLVIRYPPVLQFPTVDAARLRADRVIVLANQAPSEADGSDMRYVPDACTRAAEHLFGRRPTWCPQGPAARKALLDAGLSPSDLEDFDMPGIVDADEWCLERTGFRSDIPVVGRHSRDNWTKWPADRDTLLRLYPASHSVDVRIMGGSKTPLGLLGRDHTPPNWVVYDYDEVSVRSFLYQLDFYVYFPHPNMIEAFGRAVLEALASGCVVILPHEFSATFGDAAIYCGPDAVSEVVAHHYANPDAFLKQSRHAQDRVRERFSHQSYVDLVATL